MNYYIDKSNIHGKGIFAAKNFKNGEDIGHLVFVVDHRVLGKDYFKSPLSDNLKTFLERSELERFLNHSKHNNAKCVINNEEIRLVAIKNINKDDEITVDYADAYKTLDIAQIIYRKYHK